MAADYTSETASDRLAAVRAAIAKCLNAQSYGIRSRQTSRAQLNHLMALEKELIAQVAVETDGTFVAVGEQINPGAPSS